MAQATPIDKSSAMAKRLASESCFFPKPSFQTLLQGPGHHKLAFGASHSHIHEPALLFLGRICVGEIAFAQPMIQMLSNSKPLDACSVMI